MSENSTGRWAVTGDGKRPVVVGVDGSDPSLQALDWASDEAGRREVALRPVFASGGRLGAVRPSFPAEHPPATITAQHITAGAAERAERRVPGVPVRTEIVPEEPIDTLLEESGRAGVVVIGTRDRDEFTDLFLGCTGLTVAGHADCPVVVVRGDRSHREERRGRVVLAVADPGDTARQAAFAFAEAELRGCRVLAIRAWRRPRTRPSPSGAPEEAAARERLRAREALDEAVRLGSRGHTTVEADGLLIEGRPSDAVLRCATAADLVVTGSQRRGHFGSQLGLVPHVLLHHAPCPVAVVPRAS